MSGKVEDIDKCSRCGDDLTRGLPFGKIDDDAVYIQCRSCGLVNNYIDRVRKIRELEDKKDGGE